MKTPIPCYCIALPLSNWRKSWLVLTIGCALVGPLSAVDYTIEGEKYLSQNNPTKALTYLEAAMAQGLPSERLLLNLGLAYQRLGQVADARKAFQQGVDQAGPQLKVFLLNLGITSYLAKDWSSADQSFSAALKLDPGFADAMLNRANTRLNAQDFAGAAEDYRAYQVALPANPQKEKIDQLLRLLDQSVSEAQAAKLADETRKRNEAEAKAAVAAAAEADRKKAEEAALAQKQAADAAAAAEKEKQEAILAQIRQSQMGAADDSKSLTAGPAGVKADDGEFSLDN